jgi:hypothetical protein
MLVAPGSSDASAMTFLPLIGNSVMRRPSTGAPTTDERESTSGVGGHRHLLGDIAQFQRHADLDVLVGGQRNAFAQESLEAWRLQRQCV